MEDTIRSLTKDPYAGDKIFLTLRPSNRAACNELSDIVDLCKSQPERFRHLRHSIRLLSKESRPLSEHLKHDVSGTGARPSPPPANLALENLELSDSTASEGESKRHHDKGLDKLCWHACLVLKFKSGRDDTGNSDDADDPEPIKSVPAEPKAGWTLGRGPYVLHEHIKWSRYPDLVLAVGMATRSSELAKISAVINFTKDAVGLLAVSTTSDEFGDVRVDGTKVYPGRKPCSIGEDSVLSIGHLEFLCVNEVTKDCQKAFWTDRKTYMKEKVGHPDPLLPGVSTPSRRHPVLNGWRLLGQSLGAGATAEVIGAIHLSTATPGVVKCFHSRKTCANAVYNVRRVTEELSQHPSSKYVQKFQASVEGPGVGRYMMTTPVLIGNLLFFMREWKADVSTQRYEIAAQLLQGVAALHSINFLHRDIKPENIGLATVVSGTQTVLIDLDAGVFLDKDKFPEGLIKAQRDSGTIGYYAPEKERHGDKYGLPSDLWSVGCVLLELFLATKVPDPFNPWNPRPGDDVQSALKWHESMHSGLKEARDDHIGNLISQLMEQKPQERPTALKALEHPSLRQYVDDAMEFSE